MDRRIFGNEEEMDHQIKGFHIALELTSLIG